MNKYKIICTAKYSENFLKYLSKHNKKPRKETMQRTFYYKAKSKKEALEKLYKNQNIKIGEGTENSFFWKKIEVIKENRIWKKVN